MAKGLLLEKLMSTPFDISHVGLGIYAEDVAGVAKLVIRDENNVTIPLQEAVEQVAGNNQFFKRTMMNMTGATIPVNTPVYISSPGEISPTDATGSITSVFFGITKTTSNHGETVDVIYSGVVTNFFNTPEVGYVWLSTLVGQVALVAPNTPGDRLIIVGIADGLDLIIQVSLMGQVA